MARPLRLEFAGALYHLTARGDARAEIYRDDTDRLLFLERLGRGIAQQGWRCYAYQLGGVPINGSQIRHRALRSRQFLVPAQLIGLDQYLRR